MSRFFLTANLRSHCFLLFGLIKAPSSREVDTLSDEDEAVATDLDLHALIASSQNPLDFDAEPFQSAEEVIKEIDDLMQVMLNHQQIKSITEIPTGCLFDLQDPPSSPETSESMHQSPDTPECAMSYRLTSSIHPDSQWLFILFYYDFVHFLKFNIMRRAGNVERESAERVPLWARVACATPFRDPHCRIGPTRRTRVWKGIEKHVHLAVVERAEQAAPSGRQPEKANLRSKLCIVCQERQ